MTSKKVINEEKFKEIGKNIRVGLIDITDKELQEKFLKVQKVLNDIEKNLEVIENKFKVLPAQERLILYDILVGYLTDTSRMSSFLVSAVLNKYIMLSLKTHTPSISENDIKQMLANSKKPLEYIG